MRVYDHDHCSLLNSGKGSRPQPHLPEGYVLNDETLAVLARVAVRHAEAGADIAARSGMMDGMMAAIRFGLDGEGFEHVSILASSTKYASAFYGHFRDTAQGAAKFGDRRMHPMAPANARKALRKTALNVAEGAELPMVKPALAYLDTLRQVREQCPRLSLAAYNVSGEYATVKAAANGWLDEERAVPEVLTGINRAGASLIITYHAKEADRWIR